LRDLFCLTFLAGAIFSRRYELGQAGRKPKGKLTPIIDAALARHGDLTPTKLLERMGGKKKWEKKKQLPLFESLAVDWTDFEKKVTQQKDSSKRIPGHWHRSFDYPQLPVMK
jgi:hypothetical protein